MSELNLLNIKWIFTKIYNKITINNELLLKLSFDEIYKLTFSDIIYNIINKLTNLDIIVIKNYLEQKTIIESLLNKTKFDKNIYRSIIFNDYDLFLKNLNDIDNLAITLIITNNRNDFFDNINNKLFIGENLALVAELGKNIN